MKNKLVLWELLPLILLGAALAGRNTNFTRIVLGDSNRGLDPNPTADITLQNQEYISNYVDGQISFGAANLVTTGTLAVTGATTVTGGLIYPSSSAVIYSKAGGISADTVGANTTPTAGSRYWVEIFVPYNTTATGISFLVGTVGGTDSLYLELYNSANTLVKRTTKAICGTAKQIQNCPFSATQSLTTGTYYIALQSKGNTMRFRSHSVTGSNFIAGSTTGTFGLAATFTPGTSYTAGKAPFCSLY